MRVSKQTLIRRKLIAEGEKLWCQACRKKWGTKCILCGKPATQCHHFIPKSRCAHLRFNVNNCIQMCFSCHHRFHYTGDPRIPIEIIGWRGDEWWQDLFKKSQKVGKYATMRFIRSEVNRLRGSQTRENAPQSTKT